MDLDQLREELRRVLAERLERRREGLPPRLGDPATLADLKRTGQDFLREIREQIQADFRRFVERELGPMQGLQMERVLLEAVDERGVKTNVPVMVETRPLRSLTAPTYAKKAYSMLGTEGLAWTLYEGIPSPVSPAESKGFRRVYTGEAASAVAMEAKLLVTLKGGEWLEPNGRARVANAVAVRGLDLDRGLKTNGNKTYDDTMYVIVEARDGDTEVYEYRMTTESSSEEHGVGRLDSRQVTYVRGLHRGKDPAYRLKGNIAEGTRRGLEGKHTIVGANVHSAYTRRIITSETPLSANVSLGCQVVAASKSAFEQSLVFFLDKKGIKEFPYTIVDGKELALLDRALRDSQKASVLAHGVPRAEARAASGGQTE